MIIRMNKAHDHEYVRDTRPEWPGVNCRICGLHVPQSMVHVSAVQQRLVKACAVCQTSRPADNVTWDLRTRRFLCDACEWLTSPHNAAEER